jgi:hypothetical protein
MLDTQQKTKQCKNVAVALVKDEDGKVLLIKPAESLEYTESPEEFEETRKLADLSEWHFPLSTIVPGATYTEIFSSNLLEITGCIVEAVSLVSSEKHSSGMLQMEYVECKVVCKEKPLRKSPKTYKWVHPTRLKTYFKKRFNRDLTEFFRV